MMSMALDFTKILLLVMIHRAATGLYFLILIAMNPQSIALVMGHTVMGKRKTLKLSRKKKYKFPKKILLIKNKENKKMPHSGEQCTEGKEISEILPEEIIGVTEQLEI